MKQIKSAIHPISKKEYFVGDTVCIYQGRFGHNNIITIKSMWKTTDYIYVSENDTLPGTFIDAIKHKITEKELKALNKAKLLIKKYN
jgi:hypothetical protein